MRTRSIRSGTLGRVLLLPLAVAVGLSIGCVAVTVAGGSSSGGTYYACLQEGQLSQVTLVTSASQAKPRCPAGSRRVAWAKVGIPGPQGAAGASILSGQGAPAAALGNSGDFYLDVTADELYGPKTAAGWSADTSLAGAGGARGPAGPAGASGGQGPQGVPGPTGAPGIQGQQGVPGPTGYPGPAGPAGASGPPGAAGAAGLAAVIQWNFDQAACTSACPPINTTSSATVLPAGATLKSVSAQITGLADFPSGSVACTPIIHLQSTSLAAWLLTSTTTTPVSARTFIGNQVSLTTGQQLSVDTVCIDIPTGNLISVFPQITGNVVLDVIMNIP